MEDRYEIHPGQEIDLELLTDFVLGMKSPLTGREKWILYLRFYEFYTFEEIGKVYSITGCRANQIYKKALIKLRRVIKKVDLSWEIDGYRRLYGCITGRRPPPYKDIAEWETKNDCLPGCQI